MNENPTETLNFRFRDWLMSKGFTPLAFSRLAKINHITVYKAFKGQSLKKLAPAKKIVKFSNGELKLEDLGDFK